MINLVLVDSELETIPADMLKEPEVLALSRKRGKPANEILLDSSLLHRAIERVFPGESNRRGRPDIFHIMLNVAQSSILNIRGMLHVYIHTRNHDLITVSPVTRIPKSYSRFHGLVEDLFKKGEIVSGEDILLRVEKSIDLAEFIGTLEGEKILLDPLGKRVRAEKFFQPGKNYTIVVGGFANGTFRSDLGFLRERYSIFPEELTIWTIASEVICQYERTLNLV